MNNNDSSGDARAYHNVWANRYDKDYAQRAGLYHAVTEARLTKYLRLPPDVAVLDAGGGTGIWTEVLLRHGFHNITLLDNLPGMLNIARHKLSADLTMGSVEIILGDVTSLGIFPNDSFGCVLALGDVLSYCYFTENALRELARVARPGAIVIASVESRLGRAEEFLEVCEIEGARAAIEDGIASIGNPSWSTPFRARLFEADEIRKLFIDSGFEVVSLFGKTILQTSIPIDEINQPQYKWLIDFELTKGSDPTLIRRARWLEIVAQKTG